MGKVVDPCFREANISSHLKIHIVLIILNPGGIMAGFLMCFKPIFKSAMGLKQLTKIKKFLKLYEIFIKYSLARCESENSMSRL